LKQVFGQEFVTY